MKCNLYIKAQKHKYGMITYIPKTDKKPCKRLCIIQSIQIHHARKNLINRWRSALSPAVAGRRAMEKLDFVMTLKMMLIIMRTMIFIVTFRDTGDED